MRDITEAVGNTPMVDLTEALSLKNGSRVLAKLEFFNPSGSVKDRPALFIVRDALAQGQLAQGMTILDASSGNMAVSLSLMAACYGLKTKIVLPRNISQEKIGLLRVLGAEIVFTDPLEGIDGAIREARRLYETEPKKYYYSNQYDNPSNLKAHYETTGPEVIRQTEGRVTHFVVGVGTSGTLMGAGQRLREYNRAIKLIEVQPDSAFHGIEGLKHMLSSIRPKIYDSSFADELIHITTEEAYSYSRLLACRAGILAGISGGANVAAAARVASEVPGAFVVTLIPDGAARYVNLLVG
ncbi:MAG: cysteine synthase family protein [Nitrososphaerota archaeon]|nr:cysteine synthase family protein [Candidatus Calditenuaceae archaeon]MDW8072799.1 cysteine synthase family protein [Nitrososphaerota archaeon]